MPLRPARLPLRALFGAAILLALASPRLRAQEATQSELRARPRLELAAGISFPSGNDVTDTYRADEFVSGSAGASLGSRFGLRLDGAYSAFRPTSAPKHTERDSHIGHALTGTVTTTWSAVKRSDRAPFYLLLSGGRTEFAATWLNADNVVEPYSLTYLWGWGFGFGTELSPHVALEVSRFTAHRGSRGVVGYIPVALRWRL